MPTDQGRAGSLMGHVRRWATAQNVIALVLVLAAVIAGYLLRSVGRNWDDYVQFHPDERFFTGYVGGQMGRTFLTFTDGSEAEQNAYCREHYPDSNGIGPFFDARCSNYNPHNIGAGLYVYGTFPPLTANIIARTLVDITGDDVYFSYDGFPLVWRFLSSIYDTVTILIAFGIGCQLRGRWTGVLSAWLYAAAVLPIQTSHFATAETMTAMWVALALFAALRVQVRGRWWNYALFGVAFGAALASRFNVLPLVASILAVTALRMLPAFDVHVTGGERRRIFIHEFGGLVLAGFLTVFVFRIFNPYAFVGPGFFGLIPNMRWLDDLSQARFETSPANGSPPQWQWIGRTPYLYPLSNMILWGMGIALGAASWIATVWCTVRIVRGKPKALIALPLVVWVIVYFGFIGGNFVTTMRYFMPLYATLAALAAYGLIGAALWANQRRWRPAGRAVRRVLAYSTLAIVPAFTLFWGVAFINIYRHQATFTQAGQWVWENLPGDFAMRLDGAPDDSPWINIALFNTDGTKNEPITNATHIATSFSHRIEFVSAQSGTISRIYAPHLGSRDPNMGPSALRIWITPASSDAPLVETVLTSDFPYDPNGVGDPYTIPISPPLQVTAGERYAFNVQAVSGGPVVSSGALMTWEGAWDEVVPPQVCTLPLGMTLADDPAPGILSPDDCNKRNTWATLLNGYELDIVSEDDDRKREHMLRVLNNTEYLIIGTNRRYDSQSRIALRWPMTNRYYDALFSGELGYDLVEVFHETFELGPIRISDQYLPTYDGPAWLNEFEAEEAFHVYDHPAVFIFKRGENYDPQRTADILNSVPLQRPPAVGGGSQGDPTLIGPVVWDVQTANQAPTQLMLTPDRWAQQTSGGTWSERFDRDSVVNAQPVVTVVLWYAVVWLMGLAIWPTLFRMMPALSDRGYGLARTAAMILIGLIAWVLSSTQVPAWNGPALWIITLALGAFSALVAWRNRAAFGAFVRENWRLLAITEIAFVALFAAMLVVRLTNPDLWTTGFGGEKPMDMAYFNGVLRSTIFPPIDPWFAGGYINYYYVGYVLVGVPTLMTGVIPSIAYNLILPMLFAMTGVAAFSLAFTLVDRWRVQPSAPEVRGKLNTPRRLGNPYIAGLAALLMAVVLGNLDTPRVALNGLARLGGYNDQYSMLDFMTREHRDQTGVEPEGDAYISILERAQNASVTENIRYELEIAYQQWRAVFEGIGRMFQGERVPIGTDRWFWAPSRVIAESVGGGAITEMPFFTFVYGDLHAHMIAMPMMLFAVGFVLNEVLVAGREPRRRVWRWLMIALGGAAVGLFRAVNTWDWPTFTALGVLGLGYAWWLRWRRISRWSLLDLLLTDGGFLAAGWLAARPFSQWYASTYNSVRLWDGTQTPLWAYFDIHGLFLFVIVSLLVWETARWMGATKVRALRGRALMLLAGGLIALGLLLGSAVAALANYQVALVVVPLVAWIAVLFFRPGQSVALQFVLVIAALALALTLAVEVIVLDGDIGRQNTVFKFYIQVWLLFSVAAGAGAAWLIQSAAHWRRAIFMPWAAVGSLLLIAAALFPFLATWGKSHYRLAPEVGVTLDGAQFMATKTDYFEGSVPELIDMSLDYAAITWLQDNVAGSPVIIEGRSPQEEYYWGGRIAIHTGLPSVLGWNFHQRQQRTLPQLGELVWQRVANINFVYNTTDALAAWRILRHFDVEYVIVAGLERAVYGQGGGLAKFDAMVSDGWLEPALTVEGETLVYRVLQENGPRVSVAMR